MNWLCPVAMSGSTTPKEGTYATAFAIPFGPLLRVHREHHKP